MADTFTGAPRRIKWLMEVHPGEVTNNISQSLMLERFTTEELIRIKESVNLELNRRETDGIR